MNRNFSLRLRTYGHRQQKASSSFRGKRLVQGKKSSAFSAELSNRTLTIIRRLPQTPRLRLN